MNYYFMKETQWFTFEEIKLVKGSLLCVEVYLVVVHVLIARLQGFNDKRTCRLIDSGS